jgi:ribonuclease E
LVDFTSTDAPGDIAETASGEGERKTGRRRRRRRRGRGKSADSSPKAPREPGSWDEDSAPLSDTNEDIADDEFSASSEIEQLEGADEPATSGERGPSEERGRPRRRRRRRGGRRNGENKEPTAARRDEPRSDEARYEDRPITDKEIDDDSDDDDFDLPLHGIREPDDSTLGDHDHDHDDDDDHDLKANHRGIPTWDEAIGMIVGANLEAREKNPGGQSSSRGRRGNGRGRSHGR